MVKEGYWEGWGFNDTFKVSLTGQAKDVSSAVKELKQAFPKNEVKKYSTKSLYVFVYDNEVPIVKKIAKMFNLKVSYDVGGLAENEKLVYVLYSPTNQALEVLNKNGSIKNNWWKSNLDRKASDKLVDDLVAKRLMAGAIVYVGDPQYIRMKNGGNVGEAMASSNPYIGGAKAIQGIAPQSVSALDSKIASRISSDPNRPIFFNKGGLTPKEKLLKELQKLQRELNSSRLRTYYIDDYSENEIARKRERESKLKRFNEILEILNSMPNQIKRGGMAEQNKLRKVMHEFKEGELHSSSGQKVTDRKQAIATALSEAGVSKYVGGGGVSKKEPKYYVFEVSYSMRKRGENRNQAGIYKQTITESATTEKGAEREAIKTIRSMHKYDNVVFNHIAPKLIKEMTLLEYIESQRPRKYENGGGVESLKIGDRVYGYFLFNYMGYQLVDSRMGGDLVYGEIKDVITENNQKKYVIKFENGETKKLSLGIVKEYLFVDKKYDNGGSVGQTDYSVAQTILNQLGGMKRLVIMTGAYNFVASSNAVSFRIKNRKVNYIKITLNGKDLYDVKFSRIFNYQEKVVAELNDIYFDQLIPIFEQNTGMYLQMFKKGGMVSTQNRDMVISQLKTIHHHEQEMLQTLKNSGEVEAWVLAKVSNASSDLSDIAHYLEFR